jgi:hypothetical protein
VENGTHHYFSEQALARFVAAQGLKVEKIMCHLWLNSLNKDFPVEIIDNVELHFEGGKKLTVGCDESGSALDALDFNYKESAAALQKEFGDKIRLFAVDASATKMWQDVVGKVLNKVRLTRDDGSYLADTIVLDFGEEKREVSAAPLDGLILDYFEE